MKGEITKDGSLVLERAGVIKTQACPRDPTEGGCDCGDWCPLFGDPYKGTNDLSCLKLCDGAIWGFSDFKYHRKGGVTMKCECGFTFAGPGEFRTCGAYRYKKG